MDPALTALYEAVRQGQPAADAAPDLLVVGDDVFVDATAMSDGAALADALAGIGLTAPSVAGVLVGGRLPISALPAAAELDELRALRPVYRPAR